MIKNKIIAILEAALRKTNLTSGNVNISTPSNESFGDYTTTIALQLAKTLKKNPLEVAEEIVKNLDNAEIIEKVEIIKPGYINVWLNKKVLIDELSEISSKKNTYGKTDPNINKKVIVEFSSPNIAKPFSIGHLRSTIIGHAVSNLLEATGYTVYRDNHVGDWGTQFGKQIYAIKTWGNEMEIENAERPIKKLVELYVKFHEEAEKNPELEDEGRKWFKKLEDGDTEARELWKKCIEWSWKEFEMIYKKLGVSFTENNGRGYGESYFEDKMKPVLAELEKHEWYKESKEAKLVFFPEDTYPPLMIMKQDGATLYATRDLATDKFRLNNPEYGKDILIINEVGAEQTLYFRQLFETEKMLGWVKEGQRIHIPHGLYRFKDTKMSTRKGNTIWLEDVLEEAQKRAQDLAKDKSKAADVSETVGIGAIKWNDLKHTANMDIVFDWDEVLNMQGNSGPYMQYTYVRCQSVLARHLEQSERSSLDTVEINEDERSLLTTLSKFSEAIQNAAENYAPHILTNYLFDLAQKYNLFYQKHQILKSEEPVKSLRLMITTATAQVIKNGLQILGIETVEKM